MGDYLPFVVLGVVNGSIYALAGMGLVVTYKTSGVFNFAHGAQAAVAAYLMHELWQEHELLPWPAAALVSMLVAGAGLGYVLERIAARLSGVATAVQVAATVGLLVALSGLIVIRYGAAARIFRPFLPGGSFDLPGVTVQWSQVIVTVLVGVAALALHAFFARARLGVAMQAVVEDAELLSLQRTDPHRVRRWAWMIGSSFASLSGVLLAPTVGLDWTILVLLVVQGFGAAAVGSFTSLPLTYVGGLLVGLLSEISKKVIADNGSLAAFAGFPSTVPFIVLFVALLVARPQAFATSSVARDRTTTPAAPPRRVVTLASTAAGGAALVLVPHLVGARLSIVTLALAFVLVFASLGLLVQTSAQLSLCQLTFAAVGATTFVHAQQAGLPWPLAVLAGGVVAVPLGAMVAIPALRLSGIFLAVATLGFGILVERIAFGTFMMFGRELQLRAHRPSLGSGDVGYYYVVLGAVALSLTAIASIRRSRLGRLLRCFRDSPAALAAHGANSTVLIVTVFCCSAFFAGIAGALIGPATQTASGLTFSYFESLVLVTVLFIAGRRPVMSAFIAAGLYAVVPSYIGDGPLRLWMPVMFGGAALLGAVRISDAVAEALSRGRRSSERAERPIRTRALASVA